MVIIKSLKGVYKMKIKIWSDFVCPFCYIGGKHLEDALKQMNSDIEIEYMSYELDPRSNPEKGLTMVQMLMNKYGMSEADAQANVKRVDDMAHQAGLEFNGGIAVQANTFKAHKLFQYAKTQNQGTAFFERLYKAHFVDGLDLSDDVLLLKTAEDLGLDLEASKHAIESDDYAMHVRNDQAWAQQNNVSGVPFFLIDEQVSLSGAQPVQTFKEAINHVISLNFSKDVEGMVCGPDGCIIP